MLHLIQTLSHTMPWSFPAAFFVIGACIGSFLNVCILRIPAGASIMSPRSHCRACGAPIAWHDNVPILGWFILRGRARCCGKSFSFRYPFIELLTALLFAACWILLGPVSPAKALCGMLFASALICATFTDVDLFQIPDIFTIGLAAAGVILSFVVPSLHGQQVHDEFAIAALRSVGLAVVGQLVGSALLLWIGVTAEAFLRKEALGFQDVLLLGAIGAFCGWQGAVFSIFGGAFLGALGYALAWVFGKIFRKKVLVKSLDAEAAPAELGMASQVPFGPMLAAGALLYFLWLWRWVDPWFSNALQLLWR